MRLVPLHEPLPPGIEIHRLDLNLEAEEEGAWALLAPAERSHALRFAQRADRARFTQTRAAVRHLLARRLACDPSELQFGMGPQGKPFVTGQSEGPPHFNVSHAGGYALIVLADSDCVSHVGVDIEAQRDHLDTDAILVMAFTERECHEMRHATDSPREFYRRWVGKEAVLKAVGVGMAEHLQCIGIHPDAKGGIDVACAIPEWRDFQAMALPVPPGYAAALAWKNKEPM